MSNKAKQQPTITTDNGANQLGTEQFDAPTSTPISDGVMAALEARRNKVKKTRISGVKGTFAPLMRSAFAETGKQYANQTLQALTKAATAGIEADLSHDEDFEAFTVDVFSTAENYMKRTLKANEGLAKSIQEGYAEDKDAE